MIHQGHFCEVRRLFAGRLVSVCRLPMGTAMSDHFGGCLLLAGSCSTLEVRERVMTIMSKILQLEDTIAVQSNDILD